MKLFVTCRSYERSLLLPEKCIVPSRVPVTVLKAVGKRKQTVWQKISLALTHSVYYGHTIVVPFHSQDLFEEECKSCCSPSFIFHRIQTKFVKAQSDMAHTHWNHQVLSSPPIDADIRVRLTRDRDPITRPPWATSTSTSRASIWNNNNNNNKQYQQYPTQTQAKPFS